MVKSGSVSAASCHEDFDLLACAFVLEVCKRKLHLLLTQLFARCIAMR